MRTILSKYEVRSKIAAGPMSTIYEGWDTVIQRRVAIKAVPLDASSDLGGSQSLARFRREAQAAGGLLHPNIVAIFDYGETEDFAYIVMEYVDGTTLKAALESGTRFPIEAVAGLMRDILTALQYTHGRGVIHRDIKPANVMLDRDGRAKIADFGIAHLRDSELTQIGTIMGTPAYMSPEQFRGDPVSASTDIYSAGVILYQLLTGDRPFDGGLATIMHKALNTDPPKPSEISGTAPRLADAVVARAMSKRPDDRFRSADEFLRALTASLQANPRPQRPAQPAIRTASLAAARVQHDPRRAFPSAYVLAGCFAATIAIVAGGWFAFRPASPWVRVTETSPDLKATAATTTAGASQAAYVSPASYPASPEPTSNARLDTSTSPGLQPLLPVSLPSPAGEPAIEDLATIPTTLPMSATATPPTPSADTPAPPIAPAASKPTVTRSAQIPFHALPRPLAGAVIRNPTRDAESRARAENDMLYPVTPGRQDEKLPRGSKNLALQAGGEADRLAPAQAPAHSPAPVAAPAPAAETPAVQKTSLGSVPFGRMDVIDGKRVFVPN